MYSDQDLVSGCLRKDRIFETALYLKYHRRMYVVCLRYTGTRQDAQDLMQDGFLKVYSNLWQYRSMGDLETWIRSVMIHEAIDFNRRKKWLNFEKELKNFEIDATFSCEIMSYINMKDHMKCIQDLPPGYRMVFNLNVIDCYSHSEIAEMLGISVGTSRSQLFHAKALLQKRLGDAWHK